MSFTEHFLWAQEEIGESPPDSNQISRLRKTELSTVQVLPKGSGQCLTDPTVV